MARARKPINKPAAGLSPELKIIGFVAVLIISGVIYSMLAKDGAENDGNSDSNGANASAQASLEGYSTEAAAHGDTDAKAVLVKYTDFQWPYCTKVGPTIKQVDDNYADSDFRVEYHHFPLSFHKLAETSAIAAIAAQRQGKFFEMVEKLYSDTKKQDAATVRGYAKGLGLDLAKFDTDIKDPAILRDVRMDAEAGKKIGVSGTPSMYLNGKKISARTADEMTKLVAAEIAAVDKLIESGKDVRAAVRQRVLANGGSPFLDFVVDRKPLSVDLSPPKPPAPPKPQPVDKTVYNAEVFPGDPVKGPLDAAVTIVECTDFQWPFCGRVGPTLKKITDAYPEDVRVVVHNRPLGFHKRAEPAARAAMAAHKQGQFWPMHDKLFQDTKKLEDTDFETYATELGLNVEQFKVDMASPEVAAIVKRHDESCVSIGASGTPAFFVNGRKLSGAKPFEEFKTVIDEELKKAKALLAEGVSVQNLYAEVLKRGQNATKAAKPSQLADRSVIIDTRDCPADGPAEAVAELVIFSDFQCPFCSRIVEPVHDARKTLGDQLRVVFKQMPLDRIHPRARPAAIASLAAHRQGKFWPYHDLLFKNTKKLGDADFLKYAKRLGLDLARFKADLADPKLAAQVQRDVEHAGRLGVTGTPSVFLNGRRMKSPPTSASALVDIVNTEVLGL